MPHERITDVKTHNVTVKSPRGTRVLTQIWFPVDPERTPDIAGVVKDITQYNSAEVRRKPQSKDRHTQI